MLNVQSLTKRTVAQIVVFALLLLNSTLAFAQSQVNGLVTDKTGEPLIGVNVVEKGTTNGVITDFNGQFTLNVAQGKVLVFSYVGYTTQEITVKGASLKIIMEEDSKTLDEVVVVGYGSMNRKDVTSSITTVKADKLNVGVYSDPGQLLQGKVPGLTVVQSSDPTSGTASISLRGASSLRTGAAMEPYYVIDGIPGMSLSLIAPEDIESIDVLRDASATAIYGSKAANGVILITTKKGSKSEHTSVNYSAYLAFDNIAKRLDMMTADELRAYAKENNITLPNDKGANTNWNDEVLRTAISHNHNVSINGGSEKTQYSASMSYQNKQGIIRGTDFERFGGRAFLQTKTLNDRLTLAFNVNAAQSKGTTVDSAKDGQSVFDAMNYYSPLVPVTNADGSWYSDKTISQNFNPVSMINEDTFENNKKLLQGTAKATLDITKDLKWNLSLSYQDEQYIWNEYHTSQSQYNTRNGEAKRIATENKKKILETYINYDHTFADIHKLGLMAGYSWEQNDDNDSFGLNVYDFYNDNTTFYNLNLANKMDWQNGGITSNNNGHLETLRMISFYGRINYSFNSKYLLQATIRRDGSSAFGKNNRWGTFPSASLAWRMEQEDFIKDNVHWLDQFKVRVGYGQTGNSAIDPYSSFSNYSQIIDYANAVGDKVLAMAVDKLQNEGLTWETTESWNVGVDFGVLKNRLRGSFDFYNKETRDLLISRVLPPSAGFPSIYYNSGNLLNRGIEFSLEADIIQTKDFTWTFGGNIGKNNPKINSLGVSRGNFGVYENILAYEGNSLGNHFGNAHLFWVGHEPGLFLGYQTDGIVQEEDLPANGGSYNVTQDLSTGGAPQAGDIKAWR